MDEDAAMRIFTFDASTARPISDFGSDFSLAPIAQTSGARIQLISVPPGGCVGRHTAVTTQLFLVTAGQGWVTGADDERISIAAGQGALWDEGEDHAAGTETGMTAVVVE